MKITAKDLIPVFIPVLVIGGLLALVLFSPKAPEIAYAPVEHTGSALSAPSQPWGDVARIAGVETKVNSFITVHESISGAPAQIIGTSSLLPPDTYDSIVIPLTQQTLPGYRYIVLMMEDDGNGIYEPGVDVPIKSNDVIVRAEFVTDEE